MVFTKMFSSPRILVYLKRIANELKRGNDLVEYRLKLEHPEYRKLELKSRPKLSELVTPTVEDINKAYEDAIEAGLETRIEDS